MNRALIFGIVAGLVGWVGTASAEQLFTKETLKTWDRDKVASGEGTLYGRFSFTRNEAKKEEAEEARQAAESAEAGKSSK